MDMARGKRITAKNDAARREANRRRQAAYRERHLRNPEGVMSARLNMIVPGLTADRLKRLARHYRVTQIEMLERVLAAEERAVLVPMTGKQINAYYDGY
jgi:hypothetical protein